ncbi:hypothetical protein Bca52824_009244 [Brassica carinata]|uniref:DC1 domain-containing protein n=1 Tax=Brassica carinata TaxID=52824 RepID=A0A8X7WBE5_BRACI|nr:hypothetical protein Bca52824_009244 [Brassica carinata]
MSKPHTIQRFTHNHPLTEVNGVGTYTCNGCKLHGYGKTYRCNDCDYDLHEYCATCPQTLINTWHAPGHELSLFNGPAHMTERMCYFCQFYIQGMFYKCKHCNFESHPLCTHGLMHVSSPVETVTKSRSLHSPHAVQPSSPHHYGQGNSYGYGPHPHGGDSSKGKKKNGGLMGAFKTVVAVTATVATQVVVATVAEEYTGTG